jgi:hypothetical protein
MVLDREAVALDLQKKSRKFKKWIETIAKYLTGGRRTQQQCQQVLHRNLFLEKKQNKKKNKMTGGGRTHLVPDPRPAHEHLADAEDAKQLRGPHGAAGDLRARELCGLREEPPERASLRREAREPRGEARGLLREHPGGGLRAPAGRVLRRGARGEGGKRPENHHSGKGAGRVSAEGGSGWQ